MKLRLQRDTLLTPLQKVIGVVERKQTMPILSNILIDTKESRLSITGTDTEVELIGVSEMDSATTSTKITLPGRKLMDICKALPESADIELTEEKGRVILRSGKSRFTLSTLPADDFPNIEEHDAQFTLNINANDFKQLLQRSHFAMAQQDVRYYLNGMLLEVTPNHIRTVATDGHRLSANTLYVTSQVDQRLQVIIPRKGIVELMRLLSDEGMIELKISNNYIRASGNGYTFTSKLIEGKFPDYERVIPKQSEKSIVLERELLKQALSRVAILCNEKFRGVRFEFRKNRIHILANNPEQEVAEEEIAIDYPFENLDIGFNVSYLIDILNVITTETFTIHFTDANTSLLIDESGDGRDSIFVVMPMRL